MEEHSGDTGAASQEDAAAAWRAQRAQKACLHSDKPDGAKADPAAGKWHPMEATWRVATLPFKIAHNSIAMSWRARTRKSWSAGLDGAVSNLRTYSENSTLSLAMVRRLVVGCPAASALCCTPAAGCKQFPPGLPVCRADACSLSLVCQHLLERHFRIVCS